MSTLYQNIANLHAQLMRRTAAFKLNLLGRSTNVLRITEEKQGLLSGYSTKTLDGHVLQNVVIEYPFSDEIELFTSENPASNRDPNVRDIHSIDFIDILPVRMHVPLESINADNGLQFSIKRNDLILDTFIGRNRTQYTGVNSSQLPNATPATGDAIVPNVIPFLLNVRRITGGFYHQYQVKETYELSIEWATPNTEVLDVITEYIAATQTENQLRVHPAVITLNIPTLPAGTRVAPMTIGVFRGISQIATLTYDIEASETERTIVIVYPGAYTISDVSPTTTDVGLTQLTFSTSDLLIDSRTARYGVSIDLSVSGE